MRRYKNEFFWLSQNNRTNRLILLAVFVVVFIFVFAKDSYTSAYTVFVEGIGTSVFDGIISGNNTKKISLQNYEEEPDDSIANFVISAENGTGSAVEISSEEMINILKQYREYNELKINIRPLLIKKLIENSFTNFNKTPFEPGNNSIVLIYSGENAWFEVQNPILEQDGLDEILHQKLADYKEALVNYHIFETTGEVKNLSLSLEEIESMGQIYLFRNTEDLEKLGYVVASWRVRTNHDQYYRRYNISTAFWNIGNTKIIGPQEQFSYLTEIHYSSRVANHKKPFTSHNGVYGDGICGGATAIVQGILTNKALTILQRRNHTTRYSKFYPATINGQYISTPGIDATVVSSSKGSTNLVFKNNSIYPIVLVMNYDGEYLGEEQVFTLAPLEFKGSFEFASRYGRCYTWTVNGKYFKSCYGTIR